MGGSPQAQSSSRDAGGIRDAIRLSGVSTSGVPMAPVVGQRRVSPRGSFIILSESLITLLTNPTTNQRGALSEFSLIWTWPRGSWPKWDVLTGAGSDISLGLDLIRVQCREPAKLPFPAAVVEWTGDVVCLHS